MTAHSPTLRRRIYGELEPSARPRGLSLFNRAIVALIGISVVLAVLASEPLLMRRYGAVFSGLEFAFGLIFLAEYIARAWVVVEHPANPGGWLGRVRYLLSPLAMVDLMALLPLLLALAGGEATLLRLIRLFRILRIARLGRFSATMAILTESVHRRRYELAMSAGVAAILLLVSSTLLHLAEGGVQPDAFGSVPRAMWWSIATLTTVGYGDVYPVTVLGRILAGATALTAIGLIAMPTGILAAAFSDALERRRQSSDDQTPRD